MDQELLSFYFRAIIGHQGPLKATDPDLKGSKYNVQVEWETGEVTFKPLPVIAPDDPVTCTAYAKQHDLLAIEGWQQLKNLAKKDKILARTIKQNKLRQVRRAQTDMFGYLILRKHMEALQFDKGNKNSMMPLSWKWNPCKFIKYLKSGIKQFLINTKGYESTLGILQNQGASSVCYKL